MGPPRRPSQDDGASALARPAAAPQRPGGLRRFAAEHPGLVDALVVLWYLLPAAATIAWPGSPRTGTERVTAVVLAVITAGILLRRRSAPIAVLVALLVVLAVSIALTGDLAAVDFAAVLALYAVAAYRRSAQGWAGLAVVCLVAAVSSWAWLQGTPDLQMPGGPGMGWLQVFLVETGSLLVLGTVAVALGVAARGRRLYLRSLEDRTRQLALERDHREQLAVATERARIAREMHDVVAHSLSVMVALADGASAALERRPEQAREALAELARTGRSALADTRRLVGVLREDETVDGDSPAPLAPQPGAPQIAELVAQFQGAGLPVRLTEHGPPLPEEPGLQRAVYRIVQESLTNVLRYARLSPSIDVVIHRSPGTVVIEVDNAAGPTAVTSVGGGRGLIGMRERAAVHNGHVTAGPTATGWRVRAELHWNEEDS